MTHPTRRSISKGAAWSIPAITVAASAPAMASSAASGAITPAMFQFTYVIIRNETLGGALANKQVAFDFGYKAIGATKGATITTTTPTSGNPYSFTLSNGKTYRGNDGFSLTAEGTVGTTDTSCQNGLNGTQACGFTGQSPVAVQNSTNTSNYHVTAMCIPVTISVTGYTPTTLYVTATGFPGNPGSSDKATSLTTSATPC